MAVLKRTRVFEGGGSVANVVVVVVVVRLQLVVFLPPDVSHNLLDRPKTNAIETGKLLPDVEGRNFHLIFVLLLHDLPDLKSQLVHHLLWPARARLPQGGVSRGLAG